MGALVFGSPEAVTVARRDRLLAIRPPMPERRECPECDGGGECECSECHHYGTCSACEGDGWIYGRDVDLEEIEAYERWETDARAAGIDVDSVEDVATSELPADWVSMMVALAGMP